ncbi:murein L,D-transpeptidase catalytic domain family protein [Flavobacterium sp. NG2]|uniref:murein L,D-transpeptidase catalytic domain family protein n=1 Tax=Flavobacterium sp. NG2 TaxID=3097547 RepID=UPI002A830468|nr:murein L,D-transpeptidase catalytic domain family protein [Flavobacterium sp. NG2]WPR71722.1 murein L,D-transpeptidase catalytic domain family protein [Flavobacterium sp. NG2]
MRYSFFVYLSLFLSLSFITKIFSSDAKSVESKKITKIANIDPASNEEMIYESLHSNNFQLPKLEIFTQALKGFNLLKQKGLVEKNILTVIDFSLSSNTQRLWVIDLDTNTILYNSLVAHGRNSGDEFATSFSNSPESFKSSVGFFATAEIYRGKHGMSLRLDGLEKGLNHNARERAVVIHGANYVSNTFIRNNKRLGRSLGCPALPVELTNEIIQTIKDKSCLFIYHPSKSDEIMSHLIS